MNKMSKDQVLEKVAFLKEHTSKCEAIVKDAGEEDFTKLVVNTLAMQTKLIEDLVLKANT